MTRLLPFAGAALGGAVVLALVVALIGGGDAEPAGAERAATTWKAPDGAFSIVTPDGWKTVASGTICRGGRAAEGGRGRGANRSGEPPAPKGRRWERAAQ